MPKRTYRVRIPYVEPTYQAHRGLTPDAPYLATYSVPARTREAAIAIALQLFEGNARDSGVGWIREPLTSEIEVEEDPGST